MPKKPSYTVIEAWATETKLFGSGKPAYKEGQAVYLLHVAGFGTYVYERGNPREDRDIHERHRRGAGLLYTYRADEVHIELDGKKL